MFSLEAAALLVLTAGYTGNAALFIRKRLVNFVKISAISHKTDISHIQLFDDKRSTF